MNSMRYYRELLADTERIEAFRRAIRAAVRPGDTVLDIGTGLGTFAMFAADAGAAHVWAVEADPIVHAAKAVARWNGYGDRVHFVRGRLGEVKLDLRADVVVFEDFSPRLLDAGVFRLLEAVHRNHCALEAGFVPAGARFAMAPVVDRAVWATALGFVSEQQHGIDWSPTREYVANAPHHITIPATALGGPPRTIGEIVFGEPRTYRVGGDAHWTATEAATVYGLAYWFDLELAPGIILSNAPAASPGSWGHLFLALDPPLDVAAGEEIEATLAAQAGKSDGPGWLSWSVRRGEQVCRGHEFAGQPLGRVDLTAGDARAAAGAKVLNLTEIGKPASKIVERTS